MDNPRTKSQRLEINLKSNRLSYLKYKGGENHLLLFHGFGQDALVFNPWIDDLIQEYTIFSLDIFYHGESDRPNTKLDHLEWNEIVEEFLKAEGIVTFSVAGFSLGGRFVLATKMGFSDRIDHLILVAPDGIFEGGWYRFCQTKIGNLIFKKLMFGNGKNFNRFADFLDWLTFSTIPVIRFAKKVLDNRSNKERVYRTWTFFRPLRIKKDGIIKAALESTFKWRVVLGKRDSVIPEERIKSVLGANKGMEFIALNSGHNYMIENSLKIVKTTLLSAESEG